MNAYELFILRHAKSDWDTNAPSDFQRPLNKRGRKSADYFSQWLPDQVNYPLVIISSPALRAWQTAVAASLALNVPEQEILFFKELYLATDKEILSVLSMVDKNIKNILLIGHNPGLEDLLFYLVNDSLPETKNGKILPTAALAHVKLTKNWQHLDKGTGTLQQIQRPSD